MKQSKLNLKKGKREERKEKLCDPKVNELDVENEGEFKVKKE